MVDPVIGWAFGGVFVCCCAVPFMDSMAIAEVGCPGFGDVPAGFGHASGVRESNMSLSDCLRFGAAQ